MQDTALIFSGLFVGAVIGLTGVGGGSLMTPLLIMGFGVPPAVAVGTDLLFAAATKSGGALKLAFARLVAWRAVALLSLGSIPAALLTTAALHQLGPSSAQAEHLIQRVLGLALLLTALATLHNVLAGRRAAQRTHAGRVDSDANNPTPAHWSLPILFGALIGAVVTLTSVGAGAIGVTALLLLFPRLSIQRIVAVDLAYAVPLTLIAGLGHASLGHVDWRLLTLLLCGSLPGIWMGSRLLTTMNPQVTRTILSTLLASIGIKLLAW
jgi:uncharacterized protein